MNYPGYTKLGYIVKKVGLKGELSIKIEKGLPLDYKKLESIFVETDKRLIPFFIDKYQANIHKPFAKIYLEDVNSLEQSKLLVGKTIFITDAQLPDIQINSSKEILSGYTVIDKHHGKIGIVSDILNESSQEVLSILNNNIEILIPFVEGIITNINPSTKTVDIDAPEGLINLYLD